MKCHWYTKLVVSPTVNQISRETCTLYQYMGSGCRCNEGCS